MRRTEADRVLEILLGFVNEQLARLKQEKVGLEQQMAELEMERARLQLVDDKLVH